MKDELLIQNAAALFDDVEKWNSFLDLADMQEAICEHWVLLATRELRAHFRKESNNWSMERWREKIDTKWYLPEFGAKSVVFGFWGYDFTLSVEDLETFDIEVVRQRLNDPRFSELRCMFTEFKDRRNPEVVAFKSGGMFRYGSPRDGNFSWEEFSWYAGHHTEEFVEQAARLVERITKNEENTALIRELNEAARSKLD